jgi:hypothetical protein
MTRSFTIRHFDTSQSVLLQQWEIPIVANSIELEKEVSFSKTYKEINLKPNPPPLLGYHADDRIGAILDSIGELYV